MTAGATALVIVPTYNEAENVRTIAAAVLGALPDAHLLVVDDASPDGTGDLVRQLAAADDRVHLLERSGKLGLGTAYVAGFRWGLERGYPLLVEMDA
ncbi:glycosyltransferase, partial [Curtobacterium sp. MCBA15_016]